jgi:hypothetical protein
MSRRRAERMAASSSGGTKTVPGIDRRMRHGDRRRTKWERRVSESVHVNDVRGDVGLELEEPAAGPLHVTPGLVHPFEREVAIEKREPRDARRVRALCRVRASAHRGEDDVDAALAERARESEAVAPQASDRVAAHEDAAHARHGEPIPHA